MKTLIIGGNRFAGKLLATKLISVSEGNEVDVFNRTGTGPLNVNIICGDRNNVRDLEKINFKCYDCIVDMSLYKLEQFELIKKLIHKDTNYIFVSSGAVDYLEIFGDYGVEKKNIENALIRTNINYKIIRPSYIVGKGDHISRLEYYVSKLKKQEAIELDGDGDCLINLVFVQDVVKCLQCVTEDNNKTYKIYYVCGDNSISINGLIELIKSEMHIIDHTVINSQTAVFKNKSFELDNSLIKRDYDLEFTSLKDGIKQYLEEISEN